MKRVKFLTQGFLVCLALLFSIISNAEKHGNKVLMVISSHGEEKGQKAPGYEFDEFAKAFLVFEQNGIQVDIASPKGGAVEADKYDPKKPYNALVLQNTAIMEKLNNTIATTQVDPDQYDAVFVVGGKGAMFDLPFDDALKTLIADIYQTQGTIAAVCHGPAALVDVKLANGDYLVADKMVNGFTNDEETLFGKKWAPQFEFLLQDKLTERGGRFQSSDVMLSHVAIDERLITGQNPASTTAVAVELVRSLGIEPLPAREFRDDRTLAQIAKVMAGEPGAAARLNSDPELYQIELAGMYGYYYINIAETQQQLHNALTLMQVAQQAINNPMLDMQIAQTQHKLGDNDAAKQTLEQILRVDPEFEQAKTLLANLSK